MGDIESIGVVVLQRPGCQRSYVASRCVLVISARKRQQSHHATAIVLLGMNDKILREPIKRKWCSHFFCFSMKMRNGEKGIVTAELTAVSPMGCDPDARQEFGENNSFELCVWGIDETFLAAFDVRLLYLVFINGFISFAIQLRSINHHLLVTQNVHSRFATCK